jgi:MHS family proline/betaine transporter-like MFS transporter
MDDSISSANIQTKLTREQKEAVGLLSIGTFLEYFDLMLYVHMAVLLNELFFPKTDPFTSSLLSAFAFCSTYLLRPFGALIFGYIGDHIGRKATVIITTLLMAFSCFTMAILPTYAQIGITAAWLVTICRIIQGLSSMGEFIGAQLYLTEITKPPIQYPIVSLTSVFSILGGTAALAVSSITTLNGLDFINWRTAFWFGVVVALVGTVARTTLKETPEFADAQKRIKNSLNDSQQRELKNNPIWIQDAKIDKKTFLLLFFLDCGWPVCFYFSYIFCGNILKQNFGFTATEVIHQNFVVSMVQFIGMIILSFISYKFYPPKIIKIKLLFFVVIALISPFLITTTNNPYIIMFIQCCFLLFACDYVPAMPITYKHISVLRRFTYTSMSYALSRSLMSVITSFGLVYLYKYWGYFGLFAIIVPVIIGYIISINYFDKLEKEAGNYR